MYIWAGFFREGCLEDLSHVNWGLFLDSCDRIDWLIIDSAPPTRHMQYTTTHQVKMQKCKTGTHTHKSGCPEATWLSCKMRETGDPRSSICLYGHHRLDGITDSPSPWTQVSDSTDHSFGLNQEWGVEGVRTVTWQPQDTVLYRCRLKGLCHRQGTIDPGHSLDNGVEFNTGTLELLPS